MGCYYHEEKEPVAQCPSCGKYLCKECARLTQGGICYDCTKKLHDDAKDTAIATIVLAVIAILCGIIGMSLYGSSDGFDTTVGKVGFSLWLIGGIIPAWRLLSSIANALFGVRVYEGFMIIIAFVIKLMLSIILGAFMFIVYLFKGISAIISYRNVSKDMKLIDECFINIK